jgi:uncharacterized tellurite resistance protein B-like protein
MSILRFLGLADRPDDPGESVAAETETVRKIVRQLDDLEPDRARFIAAFAYILCRVAHADLEISEEETRQMEQIVIGHGNMPEDQAIIVVQMAKTQSLVFGGTENYLVTREFNRIATREEKLALIDCLFAVSAADETVSTVEDNVIRQISDELLLDRADFIGVRSGYRENLGVFKPDPPQDA